MSKIKYFLLALALIGIVGCNKKTEQPAAPANQQQQAVPPAAPQVEQPATPAPEPAQTPAPAQKQSKKPAVNEDREPARPQAPAQAREMVERRVPAQTPQKPQPSFATVVGGEMLKVRLQAPVSTKVNQSGDSFQSILDKDIEVNGIVAAPRGSILSGKLTNVQRSGRVEGKATMSLQLTSITIDGTEYPIQTDIVSIEAESTKGKDATKVGIGAGLGAVIGAIAGGGKGAAIGGAVGAGAGGATVLATRGKEVELEAEHQMNFELKRDVRIRLR
jgi:hypothetical protein